VISLWRSSEFWWFVAGSVLYWSLRITYFTTTQEKIFSDIAVYCSIADNIVSSRYFGTGLYFAYFSPGAPTAIALIKLLAGPSFALVYPYFIAFLAFIGVLLFAREMSILTGRKYLGIAYLFIMAALKPSLFWQLKLSTEGLGEALLQLTLGCALLAYRRRSVLLSSVCGLAMAALFLTRPQYLLGLPFMMLFFWGLGSDAGSNLSFWRYCVEQLRVIVRQPFRELRSQHCLLAFSLGVALLWSPWVVRNYRHYHRFIPVSLAGAMTEIWEYGLAPIKSFTYTRMPLSGGKVAPENINAFVEKRFSTTPDIERYDYLLALHRRWLKLNYPYLWLPFTDRIINVLGANDAGGLTTVSRDYLFPFQLEGYTIPYTQQSPLNLLLIDKTPTFMVLGIVGLFLLCWRHGRRLFPLLGLVLLMWLVPGISMGYPRVVDAIVGPTIFGFFYLMSYIVERQCGGVVAPAVEARA
jgi:hypothetical protein